MYKTITNNSIKQYDKGNRICIMSKAIYLNKLNAIVEDKTKLVEKDKRKNLQTPPNKKK